MKFFKKKVKTDTKTLTFNKDKLYLVFQNDKGDDMYNIISDSKTESIVLATSIMQELINESLVKAKQQNDDEAGQVLMMVNEFMSNIKNKLVQKNITNYDFLFLVKKIEDISKEIANRQ
jgi:hypothetical protein